MWVLLWLPVARSADTADGRVLTGKRAMGDWSEDAPGVRRRLTVEDLPAPAPSESADNQPHGIPRPADAWPKVPPGFRVQLFATNLVQPRVIVTAPNGDLFVSESRANRVRLLRDADHDGRPEFQQVFVDNLNQPFGIAFHPSGDEPKFIYVANTDSVVRWPYHNGQTRAEGKGKKLIDLPGGGHLQGGGHWTRDIVFTKDGETLYVSIGSRSNIAEDPEKDRARILAFDPEGQEKRVVATGIRNPVGLAIHPVTGDLWTSVNERDGLGDNLVPDYVTRVQEGGFYGWPWFYMGGHKEPRLSDRHAELKPQVLTPDVLIEAHSASLDLAFYDADSFPAEYRENAFAAEHGSWNRSRRTGYKVIRVPTRNGKATGEYVDFMTGFVTPGGEVWGRPVGVTVSTEGALLVTDDGGNCIWRITH